jgi:hypothetical protein
MIGRNNVGLAISPISTPRLRQKIQDEDQQQRRIFATFEVILVRQVPRAGAQQQAFMRRAASLNFAAPKPSMETED